nr:hypothetical protein BaRGS_021756 [Batillaria attramentaria]
MPRQSRFDSLVFRGIFVGGSSSMSLFECVLRTWRKRWLVVTKMSDLAAGTFAAKVDVYADENSWRQGRSDRMTFVLDHVTDVQLASSKTHPFAFEIVETEPVLVLSGASEMESYHWMSTLRQIFFDADKDNESDMYVVSVQPSADSERVGLEGQYTMRISTDSITLFSKSSTNTLDQPSSPSSPTVTQPLSHGSRGSSKSLNSRRSSAGSRLDTSGEGGSDEGSETEEISWRLAMLKHFNVEKDSKTGQPWVFVLDCGPNSPSGEASLRFLSQKAQQILKSVRRCISIAMATKQRAGRQSAENRSRTESVLTVSGYQRILDHSGRGLDGGGGAGSGAAEEPREVVRTRSQRSGSGSSSSTLENIPSPTSSGGDFDLGSTGTPDGLDTDNGAQKLPPRVHRVSVHSLTGSFSNPLTDLFGSGVQYQQQLNVQQWQQQQVAIWQQQHQQQPMNQEQCLQQPHCPQQWPQQQQQIHQQLQAQNPQLLGVTSIPRNSSVPNVGALATDDKGYAAIGNGDVVRMRTYSMTSERPRTSASVCSGDSGVVVTDAGMVGADTFARPSPPGDQRKGSNSFDSAVSSLSVESAPRKISDAGDLSQEFPRPLPPEPDSSQRGEGKLSHDSSSSNIYQDIDSVVRATRRASTFGLGMGKRRHSTGDVRKENDYEEVEALKGVVPAASVMTVADTPPELPARPATLLAQKKSKSVHGNKIAAGFNYVFGPRTPARSRNPSGDYDRAISRSGSSEVYWTIPEPDDTKSALMDFFLDDTSFHSNPMVTGELKLGQPGAATADGTAGGAKTGNSGSPAPQFSGQTGVSSAQGAGPVGGARRGTGITAKVEGVYIDMRRDASGGEGQDSGGGEYVAPGDITKDEAFFNFFLFQ